MFTEGRKDRSRSLMFSIRGRPLFTLRKYGPEFSAWFSEFIGVIPDAFVVLTNHETGEVKVIPGRNIVTDAGDTYYAQKACTESPTNVFANLYLATAGPDPVTKGDDYADFTVVAGSSKAKTALYPRTADPDPDNTGAGVDVISWLFEYATGDGPFTNITHSFIAKASASGTDPILNSYIWGAPWSKDASTSAKIFANHTINGV